ncbi:MAG TPA: hypothetical protein VNV65_01460 [Candidatus Solibacter sp.]|jgi:hypothetical protein|nr:hypothetical protein [Candidatus Solibacter sp.]
MRHLSEGTLRRMQDEPLSTTGSEKDHYASCVECRQRAMTIATEAERASMLLAVPDVGVETQAALAQLRRSAASQKAFKPSLLASLRGVFVSGSNRSARPLAALALAITAMVVLVATGTAENFVKVFEPHQFQAVQVRPDSLRTLPDLSQFGTIHAAKAPTFTPVNSLADASSQSGLRLYAVGSGALPSRVKGGPSYVVMSTLQATFTFSSAKAQAWAAAHGKSLPAMPAGLDGSTLTVNAGPAVLALFGGSSDAITRAAGTANRQKSAAGTVVDPTATGADSGSGSTAADAGGSVGISGFDPTSVSLPDVAVVQMKSPTVTSSGASVQEIENYLISLPGFPEDLAAQIRAIGDPTTTLPVPVPTGQQSHQVDVNGVSGLFVGDSTGLGSGVIWSRGGVLYGAVGTMTESEITAVARSLH